MTKVEISKGPSGPCDRPAPPDGSEQASHSHTDGRVCAWSQDRWLTVAVTGRQEVEVSAHVLPPEPVRSQRERGLYPKFMVRRADGRDQDGGDRVEARQAYLVLDPIFDPAARPALALYSMLVRQMGYERYADDLDHNLAVLNEMASQAVDQMPGQPRTRVVATWTYPLDEDPEVRESERGLVTSIQDSLDLAGDSMLSREMPDA